MAPPDLRNHETCFHKYIHKTKLYGTIDLNLNIKFGPVRTTDHIIKGTKQLMQHFM